MKLKRDLEEKKSRFSRSREENLDLDLEETYPYKKKFQGTLKLKRDLEEKKSRFSRSREENLDLDLDKTYPYKKIFSRDLEAEKVEKTTLTAKSRNLDSQGPLRKN